MAPGSQSILSDCGVGQTKSASMTYADDLKTLAISALLPLLAFDEVLGSEVRFGEGKYRADLVIASPNRLSALEIKGPRDNLDKLAGQAAGYSALFLDFSVVTVEEWMGAVRHLVPRAAGLLTLRGAQLHTIRQARSRARLDPDAALRWLRTGELRDLLRSYGLSTTGHYGNLVETVRQRIPVAELSGFALGAIHERLRPRFEAFRGELGRTVTLDDIRMLTLGDQVSRPRGLPVVPDES